MHPVVVNGFIALTGVAAGVACGYAEGDVKLKLGAYAILVLGYVIRKFGDEAKQPEIERPAP